VNGRLYIADVANNRIIVHDAVQLPKVVSVTSTVSSGTFLTGASIPIQIVFNVPVIVTGTPQLSMVIGNGVFQTLNYTSGSGTNTLTFNQTVTAA
jgi:hypothetical protein